MLIIIDGVDGSGKTTLARRLLEATDSAPAPQMLHRGPIRTTPYQEYATDLGAAPPHAIIDRWYVGEMIYGPLYRKLSRVTLEMAEWFEMFLQSRGALRLYMTTGYTEVVERLEARGEDFLALEDVEHVMKAYAHYFGNMELWLGVAPEDVDRPATITNIINTANSIQYSVRALATIPSYVGPMNPKHLIVFGDDSKLAGFPATYESPGEKMIRAMFYSKGVSEPYGFVNHGDAISAAKLFADANVIHFNDYASMGIREMTDALREKTT